MMLPDNISITQDIIPVIQKFITQGNYSKVGVLVDENTSEHCYPLVKTALPEDHILITISSGEEYKNLSTCTHIWRGLTEASFDRRSLLINIGGGVIGDMGGFCASTYKRGIDFINIPTTLLAQVDASAGGKLGVDFEGYKNHIGVFCDPNQVMISSTFLATLPENELRSGFAEVLKHGLIADKAYWEKTVANDFYHQDWEAAITRSVEIKHEVTSQDPTEKGVRKILNFGHTIGHAIESYFLQSPGNMLLHGEAIAIGMICEAYLSVAKCGLPEASLAEIVTYIQGQYAPVQIPGEALNDILRLTLQDKKNYKTAINASLLSKIGKCEYDVVVNEGEMKKAIEYYMEISAASMAARS